MRGNLLFYGTSHIVESYGILVNMQTNRIITIINTTMKYWFLGLFIASFLTSCKVEHSSLFIEAESFEEKGGWLVDPQFVEQVGSPYLLAGF